MAGPWVLGDTWSRGPFTVSWPWQLSACSCHSHEAALSKWDTQLSCRLHRPPSVVGRRRGVCVQKILERLRCASIQHVYGAQHPPFDPLLHGTLLKATPKVPTTPVKAKRVSTFQEFESNTSDAWDAGEDDDELLAMAAESLNTAVVMETANRVLRDHSQRQGCHKPPGALGPEQKPEPSVEPPLVPSGDLRLVKSVSESHTSCPAGSASDAVPLQRSQSLPHSATVAVGGVPEPGTLSSSALSEREASRLDKFKQLLAGPNTDLGLLRSAPPAHRLVPATASLLMVTARPRWPPRACVRRRALHSCPQSFGNGIRIRYRQSHLAAPSHSEVSRRPGDAREARPPTTRLSPSHRPLTLFCGRGDAAARPGPVLCRPPASASCVTHFLQASARTDPPHQDLPHRPPTPKRLPAFTPSHPAVFSSDHLSPCAPDPWRETSVSF
ncbi:TBC1 domain family member 22A isoform X12 [Kogia breviceps]|uniref:TBC1 domain family member 22A isoform X12 n=1 Tax=Kogia breviceps TaxID=27615 RepID=UPI0034D26708